MLQLVTIARNTFTESIRQPIFVVLLLIAGLTLTLLPSLSAYTLEDDNKLMIDMGLSTLLLAGLALSAFTATSVLNNEIQQRTVLTVISKPVSRWLFVLGKFLGVSSAIAVGFWILGIIFLLVVRHRVMQTASDPYDGPVWTFGALAVLASFGFAIAGNYLYRRVFTSDLVSSLAILLPLGYLGVLLVDKHWDFQSITTEFTMASDLPLPQVILGMFMIYEAVVILCAVAITCSTRLGQVMTLLICFVFFAFGMITDFVIGRYTDSYVLADIAYGIAPNMGFFWPADALSQGHPITAPYVGMITIYAGFYVLALLGIAIALFESREVG